MDKKLMAMIGLSMLLAACGAPDVAGEVVTPTEEEAGLPTEVPTEEPVEDVEAEPTPEPEPAFVGPVPEEALSRIGKGILRAMDVSPDDQYIAIGASIGVYVYRLDYLTLEWYGQTGGPVQVVRFNRDGTQLVTGQDSGQLTIWDVATGKPLGEPFQMGSRPYVLAFGPEGKKVAAGSTNATLRLYDIALREKTEYGGHAHDVMAVAWSPDGTMIAAGSIDEGYELGELFIWNAADGTVLNKFVDAHTGSITSLAFSPDGSLLASGSDDQTVIIWDVASGEKQYVLAGLEDRVNCEAWSPDGAVVAAGDSEGNVIVWDVTSGAELYRAEGHTDMVYDIAFTGDGTVLYTASRDGTVAIRDAASGVQNNAIKGFTTPVYDIAGKDNDAFMASTDGKVIEWDPATIEIINEIGGFETSQGLFSTNAVKALCYNPDGTTLAIGDALGRIILWDVASNSQIKIIGDRDIGHLNSVSGLVWSPDGTKIVTSSDDTTVIVWDVEAGEPLVHYQPSDANTMNNVVFSADGSMFIAVNQDGSIHTVDAATGALVYFWNPDFGINYDIALRPDGSNTVAVAHSNGDVVLWDFTTGDALLTMEEALWHASAVAFSPDGSLIAAGDTDGNVALWDANTGQLLMHVEGVHGGFISAVAFSPNGQVFVTLSVDGTILQWAAQR